MLAIRKAKNLLLFLQAGRSTIYEKRIIYCKQNDNYTFAYRGKYYLVSKSSVFDAAKVCSCYMLPVKVLLLEKVDPSLVSIRIDV